MREGDVWALAMLLKHIDQAMTQIRPLASGEERDELLSSGAIGESVKGLLIEAQHISGQMALQSAFDRVWEGGGPFFMAASTLTWQEYYNELKVLREAIEADLEKQLFIRVTAEKKQSLARLKDDWESIWTAIPEAKYDIEEAAYCYALERNTASVFHSMRVAEWGLRAFCEQLGFTQVKKGVSAGGVEISIPVEYSTWELILNQLRKHAETLINAEPDRTKRQPLQEFYHSAISHVEGFKEAWRNHVMHTRATYHEEEALGVLTHVQRFMRLLVSNGVIKRTLSQTNATNP